MPPSQWLTFRQRDFTGGENLSDLPEKVGRNQFIRMENAVISPEGEIVPAWQMDLQGLIYNGGVISQGLALGQSDGSGQALCWSTITGTAADTVVSGTFAPALAVTIGAANDLAQGTPHAGVMGGGKPAAEIRGLRFVTEFLGKVYCPNYAGGLLNLTDYTGIYNGALVGKTPLLLREYDNRLWAVNSDGSITFSDNGDAATWDALNIILLPNREKCIGFAPVQGGVILVSRTSVYAMYGSGTYQDTSIILIQDRLQLTDGWAQVDNTVYMAARQGVLAVSLNGIQELPHNQQSYFDTNYAVWNAAVAGAAQGIYLKRHHALFYLFRDSYGMQGFVYYIRTGAFAKVNFSFTSSSPIPPILALSDPTYDFIFADGTVVYKCKIPDGALVNPRSTIIQTRHEDADSLREKVWRELIITTAQPVYAVTVSAFVDQATTPTMIGDTFDLVKGINRIPLFDSNGNVLRGHEVSLLIQIDAVKGGLTDELTGFYLRSDDGTYLTDEAATATAPAGFTLKSLSMKYRECGPLM